MSARNRLKNKRTSKLRRKYGRNVHVQTRKRVYCWIVGLDRRYFDETQIVGVMFRGFRVVGGGALRPLGAFTTVGLSFATDVRYWSECQDHEDDPAQRRRDASQRFRQVHPNYGRDYQQRYRQVHPDQVDIDNIRRAEQQVAARAANPNYDYEYRQTHPDQVQRNNNRRA